MGAARGVVRRRTSPDTLTPRQANFFSRPDITAGAGEREVNMKRTLLIATLIMGACAVAPAQEEVSQTNARAGGQSSASARQGEGLEIAAGTRLAAQLQQTLDVRKARVGDEVILKTTEAVKANGRTVVKRGAKLFGRVTEVRQRAQGAASSRIGLVFDRLESGSLASPIGVTIAAVTQTSARAEAGGDDEFGAGGTASQGGAGGVGASQSGGLLGGVGNTVGGVAGTATGAVGQTVGTTTGAVGGAARDIGQRVRGLRIEQSAGAEASGSSTLSLNGGNLRLEKNTTFHLVVNESAGVNNDR